MSVFVAAVFEAAVFEAAVFEAAVFEAALHPEEDEMSAIVKFNWLVKQLQRGKACSIQQTVASQRISACWS